MKKDDYIGEIMKMCKERRGIKIDIKYVGKREMIKYDMKIKEVVLDL